MPLSQAQERQAVRTSTAFTDYTGTRRLGEYRFRYKVASLGSRLRCSHDDYRSLNEARALDSC